MNPILLTVRKTLQKYDMLQPGDRVIVGVSGGPDSIALLRILQELRSDYHLSLVVAHLDHGLRPGGEREKFFVKKAAADLGIPFFSRKIDVRARSQGHRLNLQESAREARYEFLREAAESHKASKIALGHTADDQAESIIMRFLRGSGTRGLSGIPPVREEIFIRPLIGVWRSEIEAFLGEKKMAYLSDPSNQSWQFLRSRVRHELLPILQQYNPRIRQTLVQMADLFRAEETFWHTLVEEKFPSSLRSRRKNSLTLDIPFLLIQPFPLRLRMLRFALEKLLGNLRQLSFAHILSIEHLTQSKAPNQSLSLPHGLNVAKAYHALTFSRFKEEVSPFEYMVPEPGSVEVAEIGRTLRIRYQEVRPLGRLGNVSNIALLDGDAISFPLTVRSFHPGDRFQPLGMEGEKKVKDLFIDYKIPIQQRKKIPLLLQGDRLLWVAGLRIDHRARLKPETRRILCAEIL